VQKAPHLGLFLPVICIGPGSDLDQVIACPYH